MRVCVFVLQGPDGLSPPLSLSRSPLGFLVRGGPDISASAPVNLLHVSNLNQIKPPLPPPRSDEGIRRAGRGGVSL